MDPVGIADDKGNRHGLTHGPAQAEHDTADHPGPGIGQNHPADDLPGGGPDPVRGFLEDIGNNLEHIPHDRGHKRNNHDGENNSGRGHANAHGRAGQQGAKQRHTGKTAVQPGLHMICKQGGKDEQTPHAVNDARYGGQQFNGYPDRPLQPDRTELGDKQGNTKADRHPDKHGNDRGDKGSVNGDQGPEILGHRVPGTGGQKSRTKFFQGRQRPFAKGKQHGKNNKENHPGKKPGPLHKQNIEDLSPVHLYRPGACLLSLFHLSI